MNALTELALDCADACLSQGWEGPGAGYDLDGLPGDVAALERALRRPATVTERVTFERAVRDAIDCA